MIKTAGIIGMQGMRCYNTCKSNGAIQTIREIDEGSVPRCRGS